MKRLFLYIITWSILTICLVGSCDNAPKPPPLKLSLIPLFADHMVVQQQDEIPLWGRYTPHQKVTFITSWGSESSAISNDEGRWQLTLSTPAAGGPYEVNIATSDSTILISDVLVGEVWVASGQSNTEMPLTGFLPNEPVDNYEAEVRQADYPGIRMFTAQRNISASKLEDVRGEWQVCTPEAAGKFTATGYFFARKLHQELNIPIGIIHTSWGGTVAEAWTSKEGLREFPHFTKVIDSYNDSLATKWFERYETLPMPATLSELEDVDLGAETLAAKDYNHGQWPLCELPAKVCHTSNFIPTGSVQQDLHGIFWYRKKIEIIDTDSDYTLTIGAIDDGDITYVNGHQVGSMLAWQGRRSYNIPKSILKKGENTVAICHYDSGGGSAIVGPMYLESEIGTKISLEGKWSCLYYADIYRQNLVIYGTDHQVALADRPLVAGDGPNELPSSLFNAMLHPIIPYTIKGAVWYQGESNVSRAKEYESLFPAMISDWRSHWGYDFPFYFVQIAPFQYGNGLSPALRDAQRKSLNTPHTGMAITLDIGERTSIHPGNKQDVGLRLARLALANEYGQDIVASGPLYKSHSIVDNKVIIEFDHIGSGLTIREGRLSHFEIAGADKIYRPATAQIVDNKIEVFASTVNNPKYVRYGWQDYIVGSLYNKEGLPASSFSTE